MRHSQQKQPKHADNRFIGGGHPVLLSCTFPQLPHAQDTREERRVLFLTIRGICLASRPLLTLPLPPLLSPRPRVVLLLW
jgi:hypothetical protein